MFWKVAGTTEIHFRILSNRRYCKSNPSRTANKNLFGKHSFHENTKNLLDKISLKNLHVTNLQNFTLGLSPKKRDPQKFKGVHKKEGSQRSPNRAPRLSNQKSNLPPWFTSRVEKTSRVRKNLKGPKKLQGSEKTSRVRKNFKGPKKPSRVL